MELNVWEENERIEFYFGRNQWSSMCNYKDETEKKKLMKKQRVEKKETAKFDLIVIEDVSPKQKQKKKKY